MSAYLFEKFRKNLSVANPEDIATSYRSITKRLNKDYWDIESDLYHCLQVGSYGRHTAIRDVSDLDMVFELPPSVYDRLSKVQGNGPSQLLQEVRDSIKNRYPNTKIKGDGQVVVVEFNKYVVEVLPAFLQDDGSYRYGDSNYGGCWNNYCRPKDEIAAVNDINRRCNRNLKHIAKMLRAWKNTQGAPMSGMLIDTLAYNFFRDDKSYDDKSYASYPELARDIFAYLANQPEQDYWLAPGSRSRVSTTGKFQRKAKRAAARAQDALAADTDKKKQELWKEIFGKHFPALEVRAAVSNEAYGSRVSTEQYVEEKWSLDIRYEIEIEYDVINSGTPEQRIRSNALERIFPWLKLGRSLEFKVVSSTVPSPYEVYWKVRNVGPVAEQKRQLRGQIVPDGGRMKLVERTSFGGQHYVECYAVKDGICVARDRVEVHIEYEN